jgi:hypothetical protein
VLDVDSGGFPTDDVKNAHYFLVGGVNNCEDVGG